MAQRDPERYTQGDDGLIAEKVGSWAVDKLKTLPTKFTHRAALARSMSGPARPTSTRFADQVARSFVTQPDSLMAVPSRRSSEP